MLGRTAALAAAGDAYLDDGIHGFIRKTAFKYVWRIAGMDVEDLVQEGYLTYYHCRARYVGVRPKRRADGRRYRTLPRSPDPVARRHFMALFKRSFINRLNTLAVKQSAPMERVISEMLPADQNYDQYLEALMPVEQEAATVGALLESAPREVLQLFRLLIDDAIELSGYRRFGRGKNAPRETTNQRFCRLLHLPPGTDIVGMTEKHFLS